MGSRATILSLIIRPWPGDPELFALTYQTALVGNIQLDARRFVAHMVRGIAVPVVGSVHPRISILSNALVILIRFGCTRELMKAAFFYDSIRLYVIFIIKVRRHMGSRNISFCASGAIACSLALGLHLQWTIRRAVST